MKGGSKQVPGKARHPVQNKIVPPQKKGDPVPQAQKKDK